MFELKKCHPLLNLDINWFGKTHILSSHLIFIRLSGVGSRGEELKQGAPDFPNIILYIAIYIIIHIITAKSCVRLQTISWISNDCVGFSDVSGSSTSTTIWSRLYRALPAACCRAVVLCGGGANDGWDNPNYSLVVEIPEMSKNQRIMRHNTNSRTAIQRSVQQLRYSVCNHTHTCTHTHTHTHTHGRTVVAHWREKFSGVATQRKWRWHLPLWRHTGKIPKWRVWASFFQRRSRMPSACFTTIAILSYWWSIGRLGELILLEELRKWNFHAMGSLR